MGVPAAIVAAALWARNSAPKYPPTGLILSGWGTQPKMQEAMQQISTPAEGEAEIRITTLKKLIMLSEDDYDAFNAEIVPLVLAQDVPLPIAEFADGSGMWFDYGPSFAKDVNVPM